MSRPLRYSVMVDDIVNFDLIGLQEAKHLAAHFCEKVGLCHVIEAKEAYFTIDVQSDSDDKLPAHHYECKLHQCISDGMYWQGTYTCKDCVLVIAGNLAAISVH